LEREHIRLLYDYFMDMVIERNGSRWSYRDGAFERLHKRSSDEFGILWFLLCYKIAGSSPIDIALLKCSDCKRITIGGEDYWSIDFKRHKSGIGVSVRWKRDIFSIIALEHFMGCSKGGWIYPMKSISAISEKQINKSINKCAERAIKGVRKAFKEINEGIIKRNVLEGCNEVLVDVERVVLYTARHSLANHLLSSKNVSVRELASILGRSPNTISTYIHQLSKDVEIANVLENAVI
jgi:hypothetical protein